MQAHATRSLLPGERGRGALFPLSPFSPRTLQAREASRALSPEVHPLAGGYGLDSKEHHLFSKTNRAIAFLPAGYRGRERNERRLLTARRHLKWSSPFPIHDTHKSHRLSMRGGGNNHYCSPLPARPLSRLAETALKRHLSAGQTPLFPRLVSLFLIFTPYLSPTTPSRTACFSDASRPNVRAGRQRVFLLAAGRPASFTQLS